MSSIDYSNYVSITVEDKAYGECIVVKNKYARALISLFGGQVLSFVPFVDKRERLYLSPNAIFDNMTPIRGGAPICWPWFSGHDEFKDAPSHGFVRNQTWSIERIDEQINNDEVVKTVLTLKPDTLGMYGYENELELTLVVTIENHLSIELMTENRSEQIQKVSQAIHTYFAVDDVTQIQLKGISGTYADKVDKSCENPCPENYTITDEVDRIHQINDTEKQCHRVEIIGAFERDGIQRIEQSGHSELVIWNPWKRRSHQLTDLPDSGYMRMICVEAADTERLSLSPSQSHSIKQVIY